MNQPPSNTGKSAPVGQAKRIGSLDVLRGFALLGILIMNVQSMGLTDAKYLNPTAQGDLSALSYACWWFGHVFFDSKFMAIFSLLFGAGIVLMWERAKAANRKFTGLHYRRMFWLLLIGLAHAHLLWIGDILVVYALCGMIIYRACSWRAGWLIFSGLILLCIGSSLSLLSGCSAPHMDAATLAEMKETWAPSLEQIESNLAVYRGSWLEQMPHRSETALVMETFLFVFLFFWRAGGLMLIGMGLFKQGIFSAEKSNRFYLLAGGYAFIAGLAIVLAGVQLHEANSWKFEHSFFLGGQLNYWGSILVAIGFICAIMLLCKSSILNGVKKSLAAVGQMALTNYLMQTVICTTIFYGHGFGWFGYMTRIELLGIVFAVWIFQLLTSQYWLNHFRFGPMEWLWRSLSYWRLQPIWKNLKPIQE